MTIAAACGVRVHWTLLFSTSQSCGDAGAMRGHSKMNMRGDLGHFGVSKC